MIALLASFIGSKIDQPEVKRFLETIPNLKASTQELTANGTTAIEYLLTSPSHGFQLRHHPSGAIESIFLMGEGKEGFSVYPFPLQTDLSFSAKRADVEATFGVPDWSKSVSKIGIFGLVGECIRYDFQSHFVHFQFNATTNQLEQVTLFER